MVALVAGCGAAGVPPQPTPSAGVASISAVVPQDGVTLAELGFSHGPVRAWSLPQGSRIEQPVDQPNQLTLTISYPAPEDVVAYLARALPQAGFNIVEQQPAGPAPALIATGYGWRGSVVGVVADDGRQARTVMTLQQMS